VKRHLFRGLAEQQRPNSESKEGTCEPAQGFNINSTQLFLYVIKIICTQRPTPSKEVNKRFICLLHNFYLFSPSTPPAFLSFFLYLSKSRRRKTLENKRWVDSPFYSHKILKEGQYKN
jgi:hypothetical protein